MAPGIGDLLRRIGGGAPREKRDGGSKTFPPAQYNGYTITPAPNREEGHWLVAGIISKEFGEETREHRFLRGDRYPDAESAADQSVLKAQQMIDLEGDRLFARPDAP